MSFSKVSFTNVGRALQAKALTGTALVFTKIALGSGNLNGRDPAIFTNLIETKVSLDITKITRNEQLVTLEANFTNVDSATGFYWREVGIFATDPVLGEILYCYGNAAALAEYIPPSTSSLIEKVIKLNAVVGNAQNVTATINTSAFATKIEISEVNMSLTEVNSQLAQTTLQKAEKLPFVFGTNYEQIQSKDWDQIFDISTLIPKLEGSFYYGFQGAWIVTEIKPPRSEILEFQAGTRSETNLNLHILPSLDYISEMISMINNYNIPIIGIKLHNNWMNEEWNNLTPSIMFEKYKQVVSDVINTIGNHVPRITILNESPNIYKDSASITYVINLLTNIKNNGYLTGLCGISPTVSNIPSEIVNASDIVSFHCYPQISSKLDKTTLNDVISAWDCTNLNDTYHKFYSVYPTKEFWIVESGVQNYWEALRVPENYFTSGTKSENNEVQAMYFEGLFQHFKNSNFIKGVCAWYFDYSTSYQLMKQIFEKYGKG